MLQENHFKAPFENEECHSLQYHLPTLSRWPTNGRCTNSFKKEQLRPNWRRKQQNLLFFMNIINWPYQTHWTLQYLPNPNQPLEVQLVAGWIPGSWSEIENHLYQNGQMGLLIETGQNSKPTCIYIYTHILFSKAIYSSLRTTRPQQHCLSLVA